MSGEIQVQVALDALPLFRLGPKKVAPTRSCSIYNNYVFETTEQHHTLYMVRFCFIAMLFFTELSIAQMNEVVDVSLVDIFLSALDSQNQPVENLTASDFILKEDGREQPITNFAKLLGEESQIPLTIVFLVDTSGSMQEGTERLSRIDVGKKFALLMLKEMKEEDQMQIIAFDNVYRTLTPMTSDPKVMNEALTKVNIDVHSNPGTALAFSVNRTIEHFKQFFGRKIMIVCSDGQNNRPGPGQDELVESLKRNDITVLSLAPITSRRFDNSKELHYSEGVIRSNVKEEKTKQALNGRKLIKKLADETGGQAFFPENNSELEEAISRIRSIIRSQYALGYKPVPDSKRDWRNVEVKCKRKDLKLRYRKGYFMSKS